MHIGTMLAELRSTSRSSIKIDILKKYDSSLLKDVLYYTFDSMIKFNVKMKDSDIPTPGTMDLSEAKEQMEAVLRYCINSMSSKKNKAHVTEFLSLLDKGSQELFVGILNKNWKVGVSNAAVNEVYPGLIQSFSVQLANKYDRNNETHKTGQWIVSNKLDGLRCIALRLNDGWKLYSRTGKEFTTVDYIKPSLERLHVLYGWSFFDGELYRHGLKFEDIQGQVMSVVNKQTVDVEYHVFVAGNSEAFLKQDRTTKYVVAGTELCYGPVAHIVFMENKLIDSSDVESELESAFEQGYEGIMLRNPEHLYDYKRSDNLLKLKSKIDDSFGEEVSDCVVVGLEYNEAFPVIEDGIVKYKRLINRMTVLQENGVECKVGSGFDLLFRYTTNDTIIGKIVEVQHQGYGTNNRMRFPRYKRTREDLYKDKYD